MVLAEEQGTDHRLLLKQSRARLDVADDWIAPTDRVIAEAETMALLARIPPDCVPAGYDQDFARHAITLEALARPAIVRPRTRPKTPMRVQNQPESTGSCQ